MIKASKNEEEDSVMKELLQRWNEKANPLLANALVLSTSTIVREEAKEILIYLSQWGQGKMQKEILKAMISILDKVLGLDSAAAE